MDNRRHSFAAPVPYQEELRHTQLISRPREVSSPHEYQRMKHERVPKRSGPISLFIKCVQFKKFGRSFADALHDYLMTPEEMSGRGYPTKSNKAPNLVFIYKTGLNVNARSFVPGGSCVSYLMRTCSRCSKPFYATADPYTASEKCHYHWGKPVLSYKHGLSVYECCSEQVGAVGCTERHRHVWDGTTAGVNGPYSDYVFTNPRRRRRQSWQANRGVYALDCEMSYTVKGLELTKVTVVGMDGRLVYESYVRPDHQIVDHNTRFSGITARDMRRPAIKNLREVQRDLLGFIGANTVLVGHCLENDLRALKMVHDVVVDTSYVFPHMKGLPFRRSLKQLTATILERDIQSGADGHDSFEDACACMELMYWRVGSDFRDRLLSN